MKITEFQRKTYNKTIDHIVAFIPDEGITGADLLNIIEHCVKLMPDNELDALFDISGTGRIKRHEKFNRDKKEVAVGMALLNIIMKSMNEENPGEASEGPGKTDKAHKTEADDDKSE